MKHAAKFPGWIYTFSAGYESPGSGAQYTYRFIRTSGRSYIMCSTLAWRLMRPGQPYPRNRWLSE